MDRDEAISLKTRLAGELFAPPELPLERVLPRRAPRARARWDALALDAVAGPVGAAGCEGTRRAPSLALGVSVDGDGEHRLAVRIQAHGRETESKLEAIRAATRDLDVQEIGEVVEQSAVGSWQRGRQRPLMIGSSIGHLSGTAGTLGCFVRQRDGAVKMLSNNHVLAAENTGRPGDPVLQPAIRDLGSDTRDVVGELATFVELLALEPNRVDCALASLHGVQADTGTLQGAGRLEGLGTEEEASDVAKLGRFDPRDPRPRDGDRPRQRRRRLRHRTAPVRRRDADREQRREAVQRRRRQRRAYLHHRHAPRGRAAVRRNARGREVSGPRGPSPTRSERC